ncbi:helix-turn-helix domain-containing protein [Pseudoclavibacter helvolus]|uniref:helix-turn-helix domain-containing protein n=1 Tax=Pseudoclavibacter helvolus TaxID=255205 RepID=UPI0008387E02|nr:helix-turn-helix domain-containing protein [Pseudoclavibacter helvolus]
MTATAIAGAVVAGAFPSVVFASTHAILDLAIAPAPRRGQAVQTVAGDASETGNGREQAGAERVAAAMPKVAEQVAVAAPARREQPVAQDVEQHARAAESAMPEQVPAVAEQGSQNDAEQPPVRVEQAARPLAAKAPSTSARKPTSTAPAADAEAREQAVAAVLGGELSQSAAAAKFGVSRATLQRELVKTKRAAA